MAEPKTEGEILVPVGKSPTPFLQLVFSEEPYTVQIKFRIVGLVAIFCPTCMTTFFWGGGGGAANSPWGETSSYPLHLKGMIMLIMICNPPEVHCQNE